MLKTIVCLCYVWFFYSLAQSALQKIHLSNHHLPLHLRSPRVPLDANAGDRGVGKHFHDLSLRHTGKSNGPANRWKGCCSFLTKVYVKFVQKSLD